MAASGESPDGTAADPTADESGTATTAAIPTAAPAGWDLGAQVEWFVGVLNGAEPSPDEYDRRMAPSFRSQVPYDDFVGLLPQIRAGATDWSVSGTEERDDVSGSFLLVPAAGEPRLRLAMAIDPDDASRIETLFVQPAEPPSLDDPPTSFDDAAARLADLGRAGLLSAEVVDGECTTVEGSDVDALLPIGSVFKLYVLGAVAEAVEAGVLAWTDELTVTDDVRSLPSGITQDEPTGTTLTVRELAGRMIAISDNTATDMLIDAVGRDAVERIQPAMGHTDPAANEPFLTTRELFVVKLDGDLLARYAEADTVGRRELLDEIARRPLPELAPGDFADEPIAPEEVEWFATPADLCRALADLAERSTRPGLREIADVMTRNPGVPAPGFDEVWFKGGSEPGVLAAAWLVRRDGRTFAVTGSIANADTSFDQELALLTLAEVRAFLP